MNWLIKVPVVQVKGLCEKAKNILVQESNVKVQNLIYLFNY